MLAYWDLNSKTDSVVLSILPTLMARRQPWPPLNIESDANPRGLGWHDAQQLVVELPHRTVDAQQLSVLIRARNLRPVDLWHPSRARYLLFGPRDDSGFVAREADAPGKFVSQLKQAKK
ncbi:MAG: hypothetical protein MI861_28425 [Pirellulales bacterium]|nr:hypothetical protein [Pirellulales bacterium]